MRERILPVLFVLGCTGCSSVLSVQPLSDDSNSVLDERLYGRWQDAREADRRAVYTFRHKPGTKATLELIVKPLGDEPGTRQVECTIAFALRDVYDLLSVELVETGDRKEPQRLGYGICRYRFIDRDTLELRVLEPEVFARAVEGGTLRGNVTYSEAKPKAVAANGEPQPGPQPEPAEKAVDVVLTDRPERILEFIRRNGDKSFAGEPEELHRIEASATNEPADTSWNAK